MTRTKEQYGSRIYRWNEPQEGEFVLAISGRVAVLTGVAAAHWGGRQIDRRSAARIIRYHR